jgi:hypothetical protein
MNGRAIRALVIFVPCWIGARVYSLAMHEVNALIPPVSATTATSTVHHKPFVQSAVPQKTKPDAHLAVRTFERTKQTHVSEQKGQSPAPLRFFSEKVHHAFDQIAPTQMPVPSKIRIGAVSVQSFVQSHYVPQNTQNVSQEPQPPLAKPIKRAFFAGSSWMLMRNSPSRQSLATQGQLGGSQFGAQAMASLMQNKSIRLDGFARATSPMQSAQGQEMAIGMRVSNQAPVLLALQVERRFALDKGGRSAFSIAGIAAVNEYRLAKTVNLRGYIQTGVVGLSKRDAFVDGHAVVNMPIKKDRVTAGFGLWGAAQPGLSRVDVGPEIRIRPKAVPQSAIALQWRHRVVGDAAPDTGVALVVGADF